jgi:hypothetical protein
MDLNHLDYVDDALRRFDRVVQAIELLVNMEVVWWCAGAVVAVLFVLCMMEIFSAKRTKLPEREAPVLDAVIVDGPTIVLHDVDGAKLPNHLPPEPRSAPPPAPPPLDWQELADKTGEWPVLESAEMKAARNLHIVSQALVRHVPTGEHGRIVDDFYNVCGPDEAPVRFDAEKREYVCIPRADLQAAG